MAKGILQLIIQVMKEGNGDKDTIKALVDIKGGITQAMGVMTALAGVGYTLNTVYQNTVKVFEDYALQVSDLSRLTGTSMEDTSRMIQLADDMRISYESLQKSLWFASKNGVQVNIDSLASLADKYNGFDSATERATFLAKTFGKSGEEMGKLLALGGEGVRTLAADISGSLVLTEEGRQKALDYSIAVDELTDTWNAWKVQAGSQLIGPLTGLVNGMNDAASAQNLAADAGRNWVTLSGPEQQQFLAQAAAIREKAAALKEANQAQADAVTPEMDKQEMTQAALAVQRDYVHAVDATIDAQANMADATGRAALAAGKALKPIEGLTGDIGGLKDQANDAGNEINKDITQLKKLDGMSATATLFLVTVGSWDVPGGAVQRPVNPKTPGQANLARPIASGGQWRPGEWALVGDMPGGGLGPWTEAIDPQGYVHNAAETKLLFNMGFLRAATSLYAAEGSGANMADLETWRNHPFPGKPKPDYTSPTWLGGQSQPEGGAGWLGGQHTSDAGAAALLDAITPIESSTQAAGSAAKSAALIAQNQMAQAAKQTDVLQSGNAAIVDKLEQILQLQKDLPKAIQDAVKMVVP